MYLGQELAKLNLKSFSKEEVSKRVRNKVNQLSSKNIRDDYLIGQKAIFLKALHNEKSISSFLNLICADVINIRTMQAITKEFSSIIGIDESECHPFCELFNIGLLGTHRFEIFNQSTVQFFKNRK